MSQLQAAVDIDLGKLATSLSPTDLMEIKLVLNRFEKISKFGKQKHIGTIVSFCLALIENSDEEFNSKIVETLNSICDYYERVGDLHVASMWSGDLASERWMSIFDKKENDNVQSNS